MKRIPRMKKIRCLVTAGATREYFDPVRFISNPSTGKMGVAVAEAARDAGWQTTLVLGASPLGNPDGIKTRRVVSAQDMLEACSDEFENCDILIMSAAVSDVRPKHRAAEKVKKDGIDLNPELERTPDILLTLSQNKGSRILVGFAAETQNVLEYARGKILAKNLDAVVANDVSAAGAGFAADTNKISIVFSDGEILSPAFDTKRNLAKKIIASIGEKFFA